MLVGPSLTVQVGRHHASGPTALVFRTGCTYRQRLEQIFVEFGAINHRSQFYDTSTLTCTSEALIVTKRSEARKEAANVVGPEVRPSVFLVDDDLSMRESLVNLFRSIGLDVVAYGSAREMLQSELPDVPSCLVLDIRLPGLSGLELQSELAKLKIHIPIIFITAHGDIPMTVKAMKSGALDFLSKPFRDQELLDGVVAAIEQDRKRRGVDKEVRRLQSLFEALSPREQDVLKLVAAGLLNKQVAAELGLAEITVKIYRGHVMKKMGARCLADLIRITVRLGIGTDRFRVQT